MDRLVQEVLAVARMSVDQIRLEPIDVESLIQAIVQERFEFESERVEIVIRSPLPRVLAHESSLEQCATNLLSNAAKFVRPGQKPKVKSMRNRSAILSGSTSKTMASASVRNRSKNFFAYFSASIPAGTTRAPGSVWRLCGRQIERMKGEVGVESEPGKGSRFWVQLRKAEV